jgi:hypothetical protein
MAAQKALNIPAAGRGWAEAASRSCHPRPWRSGGAARLERGEAFADIDRGPELPIDAVDPGVEPPDLREQLTLERDRLNAERIDLVRESSVDSIDLLIDTVQTFE